LDKLTAPDLARQEKTLAAAQLLLLVAQPAVAATPHHRVMQAPTAGAIRNLARVVLRICCMSPLGLLEEPDLLLLLLLPQLLLLLHPADVH
jgi:hypothetical protein